MSFNSEGKAILMSESDSLDQGIELPRTSRRKDLLAHYGINKIQNAGSDNQLKKLEPLDISMNHV